MNKFNNLDTEKGRAHEKKILNSQSQFVASFGGTAQVQLLLIC